MAMDSRSTWHKKQIGLSLLSLIAVLYLGCQPIEIGQPGAMSDSSVPIKKSGELVRSESWSGTIIVEGDVIVPEGNSLTIDSGTEVKFAKGTKLIVDGSLYAEGQPDRPVNLTSQEAKPKPGDWGGIVLSDSSLSSKLDYCFVQFHTQILCFSDSLRVTNSVIAEGSIAGIICDSAAPNIEDNMITKNNVGIKCEGTASPEISHNAISSSITNGIECRGSAFPTISYNTITNNRKDGISCFSVASPEISDNNIVYNGGWAVYSGGKMDSNFIQGNNERGMEAVDTSLSLSSDQFYGVESVESPRSSRIEEVGVRKEERW